jgi:hypothetical protein
MSFNTNTSSFSNSYAPFNDSIDIREFTRTFEEMVSERFEIHENDLHRNNLRGGYISLFDKIISQLNKTEINNFNNNETLFNCETVKNFKESISSFKKESCDIYFEFMKADNELKIAKEKYEKFCDSIRCCVDSLITSGSLDQSDEIIKNLFENKIVDYYSTLNMENLISNFKIKHEELEKLKYKISLIIGSFLPTTICQICLENQVDYFIDPCGHTICKACKLVCENKSNCCHYCRTPRNNYKRLYL